MNRREMLLTILAEECAEIAKLASKSLRFGETSIGPSGNTNAEEIINELYDLLSVHAMLVSDGVLPPLDQQDLHKKGKAKMEKVEFYLTESQKCGTLRDL